MPGITPTSSDKAIGDLAAPEERKNLLRMKHLRGEQSAIRKVPCIAIKERKVTSHDVFSLGGASCCSELLRRVRDELITELHRLNLRAMG
jgi:hypothetical protein